MRGRDGRHLRVAVHRNPADDVTATCMVPLCRYVAPEPVDALRMSVGTPSSSAARVFGPKTRATSDAGHLLQCEHRLLGEVAECAIGSAEPVAEGNQSALEVSHCRATVAATKRPVDARCRLGGGGGLSRDVTGGADGSAALS